MRAAVGQQGVAVVIIPGDVAVKDAPRPRRRAQCRARCRAKPVVRPAEAELDALAELLNGVEADHAALRPRLRRRARAAAARSPRP